MSTVYLALGTNLGNRLQNLQAALDAFPPSIVHRQSSHIYETPPWGYADQPAFLNMAVKCETGLGPESLLKRLKQLEVRLGREASFRYGPRRIDLDILFYGELVLESETLTLPHPRLHERAFVLVPLMELAPNLIHPVLKKSVAELLAGLNVEGIAVYE